MPLYIGIEACGEEFTVVAVADEKGEIKAAARYPKPLNFHEMTKSELGVELFILVKQTLQSCGFSVSDFCRQGGVICIGITGVTTEYDQKRGMQDVWRDAGLSSAKSIATGGIEIAFVGATRKLCGAAIACRAGSAALARTKEVIIRSGGWGPLLGDEGSGYWIGRKALNALCRLRDGRLTEDTVLKDYVQQELDAIPLWRDIIWEHREVSEEWIDAFILLAQRAREHSRFRYIVSEVANAVFEAWEDHPDDRVVHQIIETAAIKLIDQVASAMKVARLSPTNIPIVLRGGVFRRHPSFVQLVTQKINENWPSVWVIPPDHSNAMRPVIGALLFALSGSVSNLPDTDVIECLETSAQYSEFEDALKNH
jgi:N-acetylglucosamine kinase-like BadF-type ATPase